MNNNNNELINFAERLKRLDGKRVKLVLCGDLRYTTHNLKVSGNTISFTDLKGEEVMADISQINMITEAK